MCCLELSLCRGLSLNKAPFLKRSEGSELPRVKRFHDLSSLTPQTPTDTCDLGRHSFQDLGNNALKRERTKDLVSLEILRSSQLSSISSAESAIDFIQNETSLTSDVESEDIFDQDSRNGSVECHSIVPEPWNRSKMRVRALVMMGLFSLAILSIRGIV